MRVILKPGCLNSHKKERGNISKLYHLAILSQFDGQRKMLRGQGRLFEAMDGYQPEPAMKEKSIAAMRKQEYHREQSCINRPGYVKGLLCPALPGPYAPGQ
jgi:hypothetical protein